MSEKKEHNSFDKPVKRRTVLKYGAVAAAGAVLSPLIKVSSVGAASEVTLGFVTGVTGFAGPWARSAIQINKQIIDEYNAAGGIKSMGGAKLKLLIADSQTNLKLQASEAEKMINVKKVQLFLGAASSALSLVSSAVAEKYGAVTVCGSTSDSLTARDLKYYFRAAVKASDNGKMAVRYAWHMHNDVGQKIKKVGVIHADDAWGQSAGKTMEIEARKHPEWKFLGRIAYPPAKMIDASDYVARAKAQGIDVLFQSSTPESGIIIQQAFKSVDYNPVANIHAHGAPYKKEYVDGLGKDAEYVFCAVQFTADMLSKYPKNVQEFAARYKKRYDGEDLDDNAAVFGSCLGTLIDAIERAGSADPEKVRLALLTTDLWVGSTPYIIAGDGVKFDATHHNFRASTNMNQLLDGKLRCVWPDKFKTRNWVWPVPKWRDRRA